MSNILKPDAVAAGQPEQINSKVKLPQQNYVVRCKKVDFQFSRSSQNPMLVLTWELCKPETLSIAGRVYSIAGVELRKQYVTLTEKAKNRFFDMQRMFGIEPGIDLDNPMDVANQFVGVVANAVCNSEEYIRRRDLTDEEVANGMKPEDAPALTYEDGSPVKGYTRELVQLLQKSSVAVPPMAEGSM